MSVKPIGNQINFESFKPAEKVQAISQPPDKNRQDVQVSNNQGLSDTLSSKIGVDNQRIQSNRLAYCVDRGCEEAHAERTAERNRLQNLPRVVSDNGGVRIHNLPRNYQHNSSWDKDEYLGGQAGKLGDLGCTYSAIGIGLSIYGIPINTRDVNTVSDKLKTAMSNVNIKDLSGSGGSIEIGSTLGNWRERVRITQMKPPVAIGSDKSNSILEQTKNSIRQGKPVLLGFRGNGTDRHSVTAVGLDKTGNILVIDPWKETSKGSDTARYVPLSQVIGELSYTQIDYAYQFSRK